MLDEQFLNVTYKYESTSDSFEAYMDNAGLPDNMKSVILNDDSGTIKFTRDGNTYTSHSTSKIRDQTMSFTPGEVFDYTAPHGKTYKSDVTVDSDSIRLVATDNPDKKVTMEFKDDKMVVILEDGAGCTATRTYSRA